MFCSDKITGHILVISVVSLVVNPGQTFPAPILLECHIKVLKAFGSCALVVNQSLDQYPWLILNWLTPNQYPRLILDQHPIDTLDRYPRLILNQHPIDTLEDTWSTFHWHLSWHLIFWLSQLIFNRLINMSWLTLGPLSTDRWLSVNRVLLCSLFYARNRTFVLLFLPALSSLIGGFGKYWVSKYLHWLGQCDSVWWVVFTRRVAMDTCEPCPKLVAQGSLLTLESPPTLTGTILRLICWRWV